MAIADLASRQHGMVATRQLAELGLSRQAVAKRVRSGRLTPHFRGVYRVGPFLQPFGPEMAALLACPGSVLSHQTAAFVRALAPRPEAVHIISPTQRRSRLALIVHRAKLTPAEIVDGQSLSLTSPFRTLTDLRNTPIFATAVWEASYQRLITDEQATALLGHQPPTAKHEGERHLQDLMRQAGLPMPQTNVRIGRWEVDFFWPEHHLVVELDGKDGHRHGLAGARDARKQADLEAKGIALHRISGKQLRDAPLTALAELARAL